MGTPLLTRQIQVLGKIEDTPGTFESMGATDADCRIVSGAAADHDWPTESRDIARNSLTNIGYLQSTKATNINFRCEINNADTPTTDLEFKQHLQACALTIVDCKGVGLGTVNNGPFTRGETVSDESANSARCVWDAANGDTWLYHEPIVGALSNGETLTGGTSGATATADMATSSRGFLVQPISNNQDTESLHLKQDGFGYSAAGCMGNLTATYENSKAGYFDFSFQGPKNDSGDVSMTTGITYQTEQPPILQGASAKINDVTVVLHSISLELNNTVVNRPDANASGSTGFIAAYVSGRDPKVTMKIELLPETTLDLYGLWAAGTTMELQWQLGTTEGKNHRVICDYAQITNITTSDTDGLVTVDVEFTLTGSVNSEEDEIEMLFI